MHKILMNLYIVALILVAGSLASAKTKAVTETAMKTAKMETCYLSATETCEFNVKTADQKRLGRPIKEGADCFCKKRDGTIEYGHLNNVFKDSTGRDDSELGNADWQSQPRPKKNRTRN
ncbi:MAG: hypothetical protein IPJ84_06725 [Bdellovibrionales bacterium]|nr:hypothetical protein [Bdellovibrionales bacterium]